MNHYFDRIDILGGEAEDIAAELPIEATSSEIDADPGLSKMLDEYLKLLDWIDALQQEVVRGKEKHIT